MSFPLISRPLMELLRAGDYGVIDASSAFALPRAVQANADTVVVAPVTEPFVRHRFPVGLVGWVVPATTHDVIDRSGRPVFAFVCCNVFLTRLATCPCGLPCSKPDPKLCSAASSRKICTIQFCKRSIVMSFPYGMFPKQMGSPSSNQVSGALGFHRAWMSVQIVAAIGPRHLPHLLSSLVSKIIDLAQTMRMRPRSSSLAPFHK